MYKKVIILLVTLILTVSGSLFWFYSYKIQNEQTIVVKNNIQDTKEIIEKPLIKGKTSGIIELHPKKVSNKDSVKPKNILLKTSEKSKQEEKVENIYPNMLKIPSAGIEVKTVVGGFTQKDVDTNDITYVEDWSNYMNCDLYFGHNTRSLATLKNTKLDDIITIVKSNGSIGHYKVTSSREGILEESTTERGELWLDEVHYNRGFIKDRKTKDILFAYSDDGYDNDNLVILTCYKEHSKNGRWVVSAKRIEDEESEQQELYNSRLDFKETYLSKHLYNKKNTITYTESNYSFKKKNLGVTLTYTENNKEKKKDIKISNVLGIPVYTISSDILPTENKFITISNSDNKFKKFIVLSSNIGKRKYGDFDYETGFFETYIQDSDKNIIFSFNNKIKETCSAIIIVKLSNDKECVLRLKEVK